MPLMLLTLSVILMVAVTVLILLIKSYVLDLAIHLYLTLRAEYVSPDSFWLSLAPLETMAEKKSSVNDTTYKQGLDL